MSETMRVWIGCLACYNGGDLVGAWHDADTAGEVTTEQIHAGSPHSDPYPHEELWCMDHDGFGGLLKGECSPSEAQHIAELVESVDDSDRDALAAYVSYENVTLSDEIIRRFRDNYRGHADSERDYAMDYADEQGFDFQAGWPTSYIDWNRAADELFMDLNAVRDPSGGIFIFGTD